jgi:hypothetical protein
MCNVSVDKKTGIFSLSKTRLLIQTKTNTAVYL